MLADLPITWTENTEKIVPHSLLVIWSAAGADQTVLVMKRVSLAGHREQGDQREREETNMENNSALIRQPL